jgi:hypothetical protein
MLDETKAIKAKDIVDDPESVYGLMRSHIIIHDTSVNATFSNLLDAINIMYDAGWIVVNMTYSTNMFVLMNNPNYKRKNG